MNDYIIASPHSNLKIQRTPINLANDIARILELNADALPDSISRKSRDLKTVFTDRKDVTIDLSYPKEEAGLEAIQTFVSRIQNIPPRHPDKIDK